MAALLLKHGANANHRKIVIGAITEDSTHSLELVKLLEAHGADLHEVFVNENTDDPMNALSTAVDWGKEDVAEYLRSRGCVLPEGFEEPGETETTGDEIVDYFAQHFGPVRKQSLIEIVPTEPAIAVHVVPSSPERSCVTFFTTGMSTTPMKVPAGEDSEYAHAELYIELPADWKYMEIADADFGWPIHWLRWLAKYPHQQGAWLGGPVTIAAREEPPQPMAPSVPFTSMLLLADRHLKRSDGKTIQFYRLTPLYTEERELEMREGIAAPMQAFDRLDISFVVDVNRQNVCRSDR